MIQLQLVFHVLGFLDSPFEGIVYQVVLADKILNCLFQYEIDKSSQLNSGIYLFGGSFNVLHGLFFPFFSCYVSENQVGQLSFNEL